MAESNINSFGAYLEAVQGVAPDTAETALAEAGATAGPADLGAFLEAVQKGVPANGEPAAAPNQMNGVAPASTDDVRVPQGDVRPAQAGP